MDRVQLFVQGQENRRRVREAMAGYWRVVLANCDLHLDEPADLIILDSQALPGVRARLEAKKTAEQPLFLPVLLVASRGHLGMVVNDPKHTIDDVITSPIAGVELRARVQALLRTRHFSLELDKRCRERLVGLRPT